MPNLNGRKLLFLLTTGSMSRNYLLGLSNAAQRMGIDHACVEIDEIRASMQKNQPAAIAQFDSLLVAQRVGAVLGYSLKGCDLPGDNAAGTFRTFFEVRGIPHLMYWTDHPQWASDKNGLSPVLQPAFRSPNCHHFVKTAAHAHELTRILGWPNCHDVPLACDPDQIRPAASADGVEPEFDLVAIYGGSPKFPDRLRPFVDSADPDPRDIVFSYVDEIRAGLEALWATDAPLPLRPQLQALSGKLLGARLNEPLKASVWQVQALTDEFPVAMRWLTVNHQTYFKMTAHLYKVRSWLRQFMPAYLAKRFRFAVFGGDWSGLGCIKGQWTEDPSAGVGAGWINISDFSNVLARGKVVLNLSAGYDEEGITAKPFEIAAAGRVMLHNDATGLGDFFELGKEAFSFSTPKEAKLILEELIDDPSRRRQVEIAARARFEKDHTWDSRLEKLLSLAGF
jgi:glycosyltransferase involved in cell wall biosynthesis